MTVLFFYKNKGILIPVYFILCFIFSLIVFANLLRINAGFTSCIGFLLTAGWTYATRNDYYKNKEGVKVKVDIKNEFFWISMNIWYKIFLVGSLICFIIGIRQIFQ